MIKVAEMNSALKEACLERGLSESNEMTALEAVEQWSAWHIGDKSWATTIIYLYENAKASK